MCTISTGGLVCVRGPWPRCANPRAGAYTTLVKLQMQEEAQRKEKEAGEDEDEEEEEGVVEEFDDPSEVRRLRRRPGARAP